MADPTGFKTQRRHTAVYRPVPVRLSDWSEVYEPFETDATQVQASRCMDCGIPFCNNGCPLGNLIPEWNDLVYRKRWAEAAERLHATNNFPDFTGRLCPAPCETACVLGIVDDPVAIKQIEVSISDRAFSEGWVRAHASSVRTGRRVAVVGSGPAGLAAAQQLARAGHDVEVLERRDRIGGLLRYGIPEFKMEKRVLDRRLEQLRAEGVRFTTGVEVGKDVSFEELRAGCDAVVLAVGSTVPRDLPIPGRELTGIHFAVDYLTLSNRVQEGDLAESPISAKGLDVVILGGGDTGADCLGTVHRQGARSVHQLEIAPRPPDVRAPEQPWPLYPLIFRSSAAHHEGGERRFSVSTERFVGDEEGRLRRLDISEVEARVVDGRMSFVPVEGTRFELDCQLVLLAMGFLGPERDGLVTESSLRLDGRGNIERDGRFATSAEGVFVCGDAGRGQSLIVWAIAEGRSAASHVDQYLMGATMLPAPIPAR